jgi:alkylhydroperoxidase family enzyme
VARIPLIDPDDDATDPATGDVLREVSRAGYHPNVYRAIANHPEALRALGQFGSVVYFDNALTPAQRELAYLTASLTNDCHY